MVAEFDDRAPRYDKSAMHRWQARQAAELADVGPDERVLDVATGTGLALRTISPAPVDPGLLVGIDVSAGMLRVARQRSSAASRYVRAEGAALPFRSEVFDVVFCVAAVPYLGDAVTALRECRRVCRPGARLVLSVPANGGITPFALLQEAAAVHGVALNEPNAGLGDEDARRSVLGSAGLLCDGVVEHTFAEPLAGDSRATAEHFIRYGHAEPLRVAPREVRERVFATYRDSFVQQQQNGADRHRVLYVRCRAPGAT